MSVADDFDALMSDDDATTGGSDLVKQLRAALKAAHKERDTLKTQVADQAKATRTTSLSDLLTAAGAKPALAKYFPAESDVSTETVTSWLKEEGELFGWQPNQAVEPTDDAAAILAVAGMSPKTPPSDLHSRTAALGQTKTFGRDISTAEAQEAKTLADDLLGQLGSLLQ